MPGPAVPNPAAAGDRPAPALLDPAAVGDRPAPARLDPAGGGARAPWTDLPPWAAEASTRAQPRAAGLCRSTSPR